MIYLGFTMISRALSVGIQFSRLEGTAPEEATLWQHQLEALDINRHEIDNLA